MPPRKLPTKVLQRGAAPLQASIRATCASSSSPTAELALVGVLPSGRGELTERTPHCESIALPGAESLQHLAWPILGSQTRIYVGIWVGSCPAPPWSRAWKPERHGGGGSGMVRSGYSWSVASEADEGACIEDWLRLLARYDLGASPADK